MPSCTPGKGKVSKPERQLWGHLCQGQAELTTGFHPQRCLEARLQVVGNIDNSLSCTAVPGCRTRRITGTDQNAPEGGGAAPGTLGPRRPPLRRGAPSGLALAQNYRRQKLQQLVLLPGSGLRSTESMGPAVSSWGRAACDSQEEKRSAPQGEPFLQGAARGRLGRWIAAFAGF